MQAISNLLRKNKKNKLITYTVSAIICCLFAVAVLIALLPKVEAAPGDSIDDPISVSQGHITVEEGKYYQIEGSQALTSSYIFEYTGPASVGNINIILKNVNINLTTDIPAIEFKSVNGIKFNVLLVGESYIRGINNAMEPLIKAECYSFPIYTANANWSGDEGNEKLKEDMIKNSIIVNIDEATAGGGYLYLETGANSYGAAIGTSEIQSSIDEKLSNLAAGSGATVSVEVDGKTVLAKHGEQFISIPEDNSIFIGGAPVNLYAGKVDIVGNGYGSGIGNGGRVTYYVHVKKGGSNFGNLVASGIESTYIRDGVLSVIMSQNSKGACFGNGAVYNGEVAADGAVTIDGGSLYISRQGKDAIEKEYANIKNSNNQRVYLYTADYEEESPFEAGRTYNLNNIFGCETEYTYIATDVYRQSGKVNYISSVVDLEEGEYLFHGSNHSGSQDGKLYFYLPSVVLNRHSFNIKNDGRTDIKYSYSIADKSSESIDTMTFQTISEGVPVVVKQDKYVFVKLTDVPSYTKSISLSYTLTGVAGTSTGSATVNKSKDETYYYAYIGIGDNDVECTFTYQMNTFRILYDMGLLASDADKASSIMNPNVASADCGTEVTLVEPTWDNKHHFKGWYSKSTNQPVTTLTSTTANEIIEVYAKWECYVTYTEDGNIIGGPHTVDYGSNITNVLHPESPDDTDLVEFIGWNVGGRVYTPTETFSYQVSADLVITAEFKRIGYYIYLTSAYIDANGNEQQCDIADYARFRMVYADKIAVPFGDVSDVLYYRTTGFVDRSQQTTATITPDEGYRVSGKSVKDSLGNPINLVSSDDDINAFSFTMPQTDIYITIYIKAQNYSITYYDVDENGDQIRVPVDLDKNNNPETYSIESDTIELNNLNTRDKYWSFKGWYEWGTSKKNIITSIEPEDYTRNLILVAIWEEVPTYNIIINGGELGSTKAYVDGVEVTKVIAGETVTLEAKSSRGIQFVLMTYMWTNEDGSILTNTQGPTGHGIDYTKQMSFIMPEADVYVESEFVAYEYRINYINVLGGENPNPNTYTVLDDFELLDPVKEGFEFAGWKIFIPDDDEENFDSVKMSDITNITNMTGNLLLTAMWEYVGLPETWYNARVDDGITNGNVLLQKNAAKENEYIFVKIEPKEGYTLSKLVYKYSVSEKPMLKMSIFANTFASELSLDITMNEFSEGVYYFIMPNSDVSVAAVFEPIEYTITYLNSGTNANPDKYTVIDEFDLKAPSKSGYKFLGWFDKNGEKVSKIASMTGDVVLTAQWEAINVDPIPQDPNDETKEPDSSNNTDDTKGNNNEDETTKKNSYVSPNGGISTGDKSGNKVVHLVFVCMVTSFIAFWVISKRDKDEVEE